MEDRKNIVLYKKMVGKCFVMNDRSKKRPSLYFHITKYSVKKQCYIVNGFLNSPFCNLPISQILKWNIHKNVNFYKPMEEIKPSEYKQAKLKLMAILN